MDTLYDSTENEVWKDIPGYNGLYQVSNFGRVKSFKRYSQGKLLRPKGNGAGYLKVCLYRDKKQNNVYVHHIVMLTFIGERPHGLDINHKDGNKTNNHLSNLEYCTRSKNVRHAFEIGLHVGVNGEKHGRSNLTKLQVLEIRARYKAGGVLQKELAQEYGVGPSTISSIVIRTSWKHI